MVKSEGFKGFFKKTSNRDACTRLMELTHMQVGLGKTEQGWTNSSKTFQIGIEVSDLMVYTD